MKILIFSPYYPPHIGGLESHADEFNKHLSQKGVDITVFTPRLPEDAPETEIKYNNVKIIRFPAFEIISNYPLPKFWTKKYQELRREINTKNFDIVISRTRFFNTSLMAMVYAKTKKIKWIHIEHGSDFVKLSSGFKTFVAKLYDYTFGSLVFKFSDINVSISKTVNEFVKKFDKRNSPVIYRGLDFKKIDNINQDPEIKEKFEGKIIISFAGRLYKWKGVENTVKAIKSLPEKIKSKIVFLVLGDGEDYARIKKLVGEDKSIEMFGSLKWEKVISILKITDIYVHSSLPGGGLSTSLLEAMYSKCAVIATPNEGADEVIQDNENGLLIENSDPKTISKKIIELIEDKDKIGLFSEKASKKTLDFFTWDKSIEKYLTILKK